MPPRPRRDSASPPSCSVAQIQDTRDEVLMPFVDACRNNDAELALRLASGREDALLTYGLNEAMKAGHLALARRLFELGVMYDADTVEQARLSLDAGKLLLEFGFKVNDPCALGNTFLTGLVLRNDIAYVRYLLELGANPNLGPNLTSNTSRSIRVADIRPAEDSGFCLNVAAASSTLEMFALLLEHGAKIEYAIPLHSAAGFGTGDPSGDRIPMMEYLVGLGVDVNGLDDRSTHGNHGTPLHYAVLWRRVEEGKWLLNHGADPDKKSHWDMSARDYAARWKKDNELAALVYDY